MSMEKALQLMPRPCVNDTHRDDDDNGKWETTWTQRCHGLAVVDRPVVVETSPGPMWSRSVDGHLRYAWGVTETEAFTAQKIKDMGEVHSFVLVLDYDGFSRGYRGGINANKHDLAEMIALYKGAIGPEALKERLSIALMEFTISPEMMCYRPQVENAAVECLVEELGCERGAAEMRVHVFTETDDEDMREWTLGMNETARDAMISQACRCGFW